MQPRDEMPAEHRFAQNFSTHLSNKNSWTSQGKIQWYTDGSLTDERSGLGFVGPRLKYRESLGRNTSIFQAEFCAIGRCAEYNLQRNYHGKDIAILFDSQAAIKALSKAKITSKLVNEVRTALDKLGAVNKFTIRWVPGHNNIPGNELAETLVTNIMRRTRYGMLRPLSKGAVQGNRHWLIIVTDLEQAEP